MDRIDRIAYAHEEEHGAQRDATMLSMCRTIQALEVRVRRLEEGRPN